MSQQNEQIERRERLRKLALETVDLAKDPYFMKNHLGTFECKLCLTLHNNEGNYLAHTQGKRHQQNLGRRAAREQRDAPVDIAPTRNRIEPRKTIKIGRPGYKVTKQMDHETKQRSLLFQIDLPGVHDTAVAAATPAQSPLGGLARCVTRCHRRKTALPLTAGAPFPCRD